MPDEDDEPDWATASIEPEKDKEHGRPHILEWTGGDLEMAPTDFAPLRVADPEASTELVRILDWAANSIEAIDPEPAADPGFRRACEPAIITECPHKYNDAWYDDFWFAVQTGQTYWEQSQFFEGGRYDTDEAEPLLRERSQFTAPLTPDEVRNSGAQLLSDRVARLRNILDTLRGFGWRTYAERAFGEKRDLIGLVIERGQRWFVLETPNLTDTDIFAWDADGLFRVGMTRRIDQAVSEPLLLVFATVEPTAVDRLGPVARSYFRPQVADHAAARTLHDLLTEAVGAVRATTNAPVALKSGRSRTMAHAHAGPFSSFVAASYSPILRPDEGDLRLPRDGVWPEYRSQYAREPEGEYTDEAKGLHLALGALEDVGWRSIFEAAYGEPLQYGQLLALIVNEDRALLVRDNAVFEIGPTEIGEAKVRDHSDIRDPAMIIGAVDE